MKVWSYEEIKDCYKSIYADLNWKDVEGRFTKWGKTPRICFTLRDNTLESNLQSVLQIPDLLTSLSNRSKLMTQSSHISLGVCYEENI